MDCPEIGDAELKSGPSSVNNKNMFNILKIFPVLLLVIFETGKHDYNAVAVFETTIVILSGYYGSIPT